MLISEPVPVLMSAALVPPRLVGAVFGGQLAVRVWCGHVGARVVVEDGTGNILVDMVVVREDNWYWLQNALMDGTELVVRQEWRRGSLSWSASAPVRAIVASASGRPRPWGAR